MFEKRSGEGVALVRQHAVYKQTNDTNTKKLKERVVNVRGVS